MPPNETSQTSPTPLALPQAGNVVRDKRFTNKPRSCRGTWRLGPKASWRQQSRMPMVLISLCEAANHVLHNTTTSYHFTNTGHSR